MFSTLNLLSTFCISGYFWFKRKYIFFIFFLFQFWHLSKELNFDVNFSGPFWDMWKLILFSLPVFCSAVLSSVTGVQPSPGSNQPRQSFPHKHSHHLNTWKGKEKLMNKNKHQILWLGPHKAQQHKSEEEINIYIKKVN